MTASASPPGFSPWRVVVGATLALIVGNGPVMQFTFGVFLKPIAQDLSLTRGTVSAALSVGLFGTALAAPVVGRAMDRFGTLRIVLPSVLGLALMLALQGALATGATSLFLLSALMGIAAAGQTPIGYARTIVTWFDRRRGLALGIVMTGVGIGTILLPILASRLIATVGWRLAYVGLAVFLLAVAVPAILLCIREGPALRVMSGAEARRAAAFARRTPTFLKLAAAFTLVAFAANGVIAHIVPMLTDRGMDAGRAAASLASLGVALICGRLAAGWLLDRLDSIFVATAFFALVLVGIALLGAGSAILVTAALFLIGLGLGAEIDLLAFMIGRFFGTAIFGELYGTIFSMFMIGSSVGPFAIGYSYDRFGTYHIALIGADVALVGAIALILSIKRTPEIRGPRLPV